MKTAGLVLLILGACLPGAPTPTAERSGPAPGSGGPADWKTKARRLRLSAERDHVAAEIRDGLVFAGEKTSPAVEELQTNPEDTCEDNVRRICRAFARVSPSFGKAWRLYLDGDWGAALEAVEPGISPRDTSYFAAAKRFVQAESLVGAGRPAEGAEAYLDLVGDMAGRLSFASLALERSGRTFEKMRRRFYAMSLYRLWVEVFGLLDDGTAAELTRKAERIEADYRDPMETIAGKMSQVRDMLERADSGRRNQQTQQEILEQLDDLIALLEEREQPPPGGDDDARRARLPPGAEASGPARVSELPRDTSVRRRPAKAKIHPSGLSDAWGLLPAGEREKLLESFSEGLPERYRQMIREYFMRLAKQRDPRPTTAPGAGRR